MEENGISRILIGFHFGKAVEAGIEHGRRIANRAVSRFLRPVHGRWDWSWSDDDEARSGPRRRSNRAEIERVDAATTAAWA